MPSQLHLRWCFATQLRFSHFCIRQPLRQMPFEYFTPRQLRQIAVSMPLPPWYLRQLSLSFCAFTRFQQLNIAIDISFQAFLHWCWIRAFFHWAEADNSIIHRRAGTEEGRGWYRWSWNRHISATFSPISHYVSTLSSFQHISWCHL